MTDPIIELFAPDTCQKIARDFAVEVARIVGSKVVKNSRLVLGKAYCPYKVPLHTKDFWCTLSISDTSFTFRSNHRRQTVKVLELCNIGVTAKSPSKFHPASQRVPAVSEVVGVDIYTTPHHSCERVAEWLLSGRALPLLRALDFRPIREFSMNPIQLHVASSARLPADCAKQALAFRDLQTSVFEDALSRSQESDG
jgi:hypothetical protein